MNPSSHTSNASVASGSHILVVDFFFDPDDLPLQSAADIVEPDALDSILSDASRPSPYARSQIFTADMVCKSEADIHVAAGVGEKIRMLGQRHYPDRAPQFVASREMNAPCALTAKMTASHAHRRTLRHIPGGGIVLAVVLGIPLWALIISVFMWVVR